MFVVIRSRQRLVSYYRGKKLCADFGQLAAFVLDSAATAGIQVATSQKTGVRMLPKLHSKEQQHAMSYPLAATRKYIMSKRV